MFGDGNEDTEFYYPLLMVKDFNQDGFTESKEFMTNGDVATIAFSGLKENPINPSTGKAITNDAKTELKQYIWASLVWDTSLNNGTVYTNPDFWNSVHTDRRDLNN